MRITLLKMKRYEKSGSFYFTLRFHVSYEEGSIPPPPICVKDTSNKVYKWMCDTRRLCFSSNQSYLFVACHITILGHGAQNNCFDDK